ncbi:MAG: hypothetical protein Q9208_004074 [Pyrenodesmia sp. 3 TL-2023]
MAPSSKKRIHRAPKANQSSKAAAKRKGDSFDSGYGGSNGRSPTPRTQRTVRHDYRSQTKHHAELPGLQTDLHTTRRPPHKAVPKKQRRIKFVHPNEGGDDGGLLSPVDRQLQAETLATIPRSDSESHARLPRADTTNLDDETTETLRYFALPENRNNEEAIQQLFFQTFQEQTPTDTTYKHRYQALKQAAWDWAKSTFHVPNAPSSSEPLNLMELATEHPELMEYINATTAAPAQGTTTWEEMLNTKRAEIAYCILGKVLDVHVFGEELFGATPHQKKMLRMADLEFFDADGFPRQLTRSHLITSFLPPSSPIPTSFLPALHTLHHRVTALLEPLLPHHHPILSPSTSHLFPLLLLATTLHLSLRLHNPHTIYHFPPSPSATSSCAFSAEEMSIRDPDPNDDDDDHHAVRKGRSSSSRRIVVTMAGWPGCIAYRAVVDPSPPPSSSPGISTHVLAKADVFVRVQEEEEEGEAVRGGGGNRKRGEQGGKARCLREEMWARHEQERTHAQLKKRAGLAAAVGVGVTALGGWLDGRGGGGRLWGWLGR